MVLLFTIFKKIIFCNFSIIYLTCIWVYIQDIESQFKYFIWMKSGNMNTYATNKYLIINAIFCKKLTFTSMLEFTLNADSQNALQIQIWLPRTTFPLGAHTFSHSQLSDFWSLRPVSHSLPLARLRLLAHLSVNTLSGSDAPSWPLSRFGSVNRSTMSLDPSSTGNDSKQIVTTSGWVSLLREIPEMTTLARLIFYAWFSKPLYSASFFWFWLLLCSLFFEFWFTFIIVVYRSPDLYPFLDSDSLLFWMCLPAFFTLKLWNWKLKKVLLSPQMPDAL